MLKTKLKNYSPTIVTAGNLACGFGAIVLIMHKELSYAAWLVIAAMVFDGLDGQLARLLKSNVTWGGHFDSFADMITFGLAPAFLLGSIDAFNTHIAIWFVCFLFTLCAVIRLAKFEADSTSENVRSKYFTGLPSTLAGGTVASLILLDSYLKTKLGVQTVATCLPSVTFILSLLMLSKVQYIKIVDVIKKKHGPAASFTIIGTFITLLVLFIMYPSIMLPLGFCVYVIIGNQGIFKKRFIQASG
ncbi:MAG: CDP-diacylglycerol--serine O-phosphatidyltransferase [Planctomycetes bacterium]|nr:CDP-diacylglycerol--serine O-phosphatidyltransferase [Planctomycetota bacterium]